jgi:hypothetical protein
MLINKDQDRRDDRMVRRITVFAVLGHVLFRVVLPLMSA